MIFTYFVQVIGCVIQENQQVKSTHLTLETDPICSSNTTSNVGVEGDYIDLICWVKYKGKWAPTMRWQNEADEIPSKDESQGNMVKFSAVVQLMPSHNGKSFTCRTFFDQPEKGILGPNTAENFPVNDGAYPEVCTTPTLTVYCEYRSHDIVVSIHIVHQLIAKLDSVVCLNTWKRSSGRFRLQCPD